MIIDFNDETSKVTSDQENELKEIIKYTLEIEQMPPNCEVSISFLFDDDIQTLNEQYRQINEPTDVLSFPIEQSLKDKTGTFDLNIPLLLGDIIVSIDHAIEQAEQYGHSLKREISFLIVHGLLHLLGYTHDTDENEKEMFQKQDKILGAFKIERE